MLNPKKDPMGLLARVDGWSSHRPVLFGAIDFLSERGDEPVVFELGMGFGSTPQLHDWAMSTQSVLWSVEHDVEWVAKFGWLANQLHHITHLQDPEGWAGTVQHLVDNCVGAGVALVDQAPAGSRSPVIDVLRERVPLVVVHDTEPTSEHGYRMHDAMQRYRFRRDFMRGNTGTALLSMTIDVSEIPIPQVD